MSYRTMFRESVGEIPPTTIDVERVIARQRRRIRLRRLGVMAAAVVTVGAVTFGAAAVVGRPRAELPAAPKPTKPAVRTPEPQSGQRFTQMDLAIFEAVGRVAPDLEWAPGDKGGAWLSGAATRGYTPSGYMGQGRVRSGDRTGYLLVQIEEGESPDPCTADAVRMSGCAITTGPAGEKIRTTSARNPARGPARGTSEGLAVSSDVFVARPDGVVLIVSVRGDDDNPPLSIEQLTALALDPAVAGPAAHPLQGDPEARRRWIDSAVLGSLQRHVPGVTGAEGRGVAVTPNDLGGGWSGRPAENTADSYVGQGRVLVDGVAGVFLVRIQRRDPGSSGDLTCAEPTRTYTCETGDGPDGERYRITTDTSRRDYALRTVHLSRRDGAWLTVTHVADAKGKFAVTAAQQRAVALDPAVALTDRFG
ncbi:hypothetical protein ACGFIE_03620 [Micromonospora sp. NPDC049275]|uniref:hypothetical protein n=1 Tax=Micromonospora sp. NPDC049275 TaxID=3364268 RepID=UPI00371D0B2B